VPAAGRTLTTSPTEASTPQAGSSGQGTDGSSSPQAPASDDSTNGTSSPTISSQVSIGIKSLETVDSPADNPRTSPTEMPSGTNPVQSQILPNIDELPSQSAAPAMKSLREFAKWLWLLLVVIVAALAFRLWRAWRIRQEESDPEEFS